MENKEMIEKLMEKTKVSEEEAKEALEKCNYDILDAIIYLERKEKYAKDAQYIDLSKDDNKEKEKEGCGFGKVLGRFFRCIGKLISKGNKNYFEIKDENNKPIKISLTISVILLVLAFWPVVILLVIGLFLGYKYSIVGPNINNENINDILEKASTSAENIKNDFNEGYKNN